MKCVFSKAVLSVGKRFPLSQSAAAWCNTFCPPLALYSLISFSHNASLLISVLHFRWYSVRGVFYWTVLQREGENIPQTERFLAKMSFSGAKCCQVLPLAVLQICIHILKLFSPHRKSHDCVACEPCSLRSRNIQNNFLFIHQSFSGAGERALCLWMYKWFDWFAQSFLFMEIVPWI